MSDNKNTQLVPFDVAEHLRTPEEIAAYLVACMDESNGEATVIAKALDDVARAQGMRKPAGAAATHPRDRARAIFTVSQIAETRK
jgi:probable addiction module antidote protein